MQSPKRFVPAKGDKDDVDVVIFSQAPTPIPIENRENVAVVTANRKPSWKPRLITIEPVIYLFVVAGALQDPTLNALVYEKVCNTHFSGNICEHLHVANHSDEEDIVQGESSYWILYHNLCYEIPAILLALLYGSFSDNVSRRAAIALPCVGQMICGISFIINAVYIDSPVVYTLIGQVISGFTGGWIACFMALFSYLGEATPIDKRTQRVMIAEGVAAIGAAKSLIISGWLFDNTNYVTVFSIAATLNFVAAVYCFVGLQEPPKNPDHQLRGNYVVAFGRKFKETIACVFRKREDNGRARLIVSLGIVLFGMISFNCIYKVGYLFLRRQPLSWSQSMYGYFAACLQFVPGIAMLFVIPAMKARLHMRDTSLIIIGISSSAVSEFYLSFCTTTWMVWLMPFLAFLKGGTWVVRSVVSKLVDPNELGAMYAALGALQSVSGMVGAAIYNTIYPHTLTTWAGACFTIGAAMCSIPLGLTIWLHYDTRKRLQYQTLTENNTSVQNVENISRLKVYGSPAGVEFSDREGDPLVASKSMIGNNHYGFSLFI